LACLLGGCSWLGLSPANPGRTPEPPAPPDLGQFTRVQGEPILPTGKVVYDCGPEALTCVLRYFGKQVDVDEITARIYDPQARATLSTQLAPMARQLGVAARYVDGTIGRIKQCVDRNEPPIIMVRVKDDLYHFCVVSGYSDRLEMVLCEEYGGAKRAIGYRELKQLWEPTNYFMLALAPSTAETDFAAGAELEDRGQFREAIGRYESALARDPAHQPSLVGLGNCYVGLREHARAIEHYRRALQLYDADPKALNNLAHALWETGERLEEARKYADRSVQLYADRLDHLRNVEKTQSGMGTDERVRSEVHRRINATQVELALAYGTLAAVRYATKEYALAIAAWKASYDLLDLAYVDLRARRLLMIARSYKELKVRSQWLNYLEDALRLAQDARLREEIRNEQLEQPE
jgi:Tfp pilus assembly protein PilF